MVWAGGGYGGQVAVRFDAKKVIRRNLFPGKKPGNREVCDIVKDPAEKNDIAAENRDLIDRAIAILDREYKPAPGFQALRYEAPVTAQDSCDMRDRLLRYFATCG